MVTKSSLYKSRKMLRFFFENEKAHGGRIRDNPILSKRIAITFRDLYPCHTLILMEPDYFTFNVYVTQSRDN